jgi:response regulator of citrate/malate metabolism
MDYEATIKSIARDLPIHKASATFNVPYPTQKSHANNFILYGIIGRPTKFTVDEEVYLEQAPVALQVSES